MKKCLSIVLSILLLLQPSLVRANDLAGITLPPAGAMVGLTPAFQPVLLRGLTIDPSNPLRFDFIVDQGESHLDDADLRAESQRMINYFLAALAVPRQDLWVNLSPVEKDRIVPDALIKTELGRDFLAQDYLLKQLTASLIYPEKGLGKEFWQRVHAKAYATFGITDVPVDVFNKVWIVPQRATVMEKENTVYITGAHLKVMLESDYKAQASSSQGVGSPVEEMTKKLLREIMVPAIEKEVNEGANFARLRQAVYALVLAQWYQDVVKESVLNKAYAGKSKVAGIDLSDPASKALIYEQYMSAYRKGVFNYIKEEADRSSDEPVARKYFSGGISVPGVVPRDNAGMKEMPVSKNEFKVSVNIEGADAAEVAESASSWYRLDRPRELLAELKASLTPGGWQGAGVKAFMDKYAAQVESEVKYPVEGAWPVLKAITLLEKNEEASLLQVLGDLYKGKKTKLVDAIFLMNNIYAPAWYKEQAPHIAGRAIYYVAAEIHHWAGGLGPVMKFHGKGMKDLGANVSYIEPWYQLRRDKGNPDGDPLDYTDPDMGLRDMNDNFDEFEVDLGDKGGVGVHRVRVQVASGIDENGIRVYMVRDVNPDGTSYYTRMLYNYGGRNNPVSKEESMAFINVASARLVMRLEEARQQKEGAAWRPAIVHGNDGQFGPLQAVAMSRHGDAAVMKDIFWAYTTHTYRNRGGNGKDWGVSVFLQHMMGIVPKYFNAFRQWNDIDHTSGGIRLANWAGAVSNKHRNDVSVLDPNSNVVAVTNGAVPEEMAEIFRAEFVRLKKEGKISPDADHERPTAEEVALTKVACKQRLNALKIPTANGGFVEVDLDRPLVGYSRRLVPEKAGRDRAFTDENIRAMVRLGYNVVILGALQGDNRDSHMLAAGLRRLESEIAAAKIADPLAYMGNFQFVQAFTPGHKKAFLAAEDLQVQDSDNHTGAAEFSEEDITANAGVQGGATFREGVIIDQGILVNMNVPGQGNTVIPLEDTPDSWRDTVFGPLMTLWHKDRGHVDFYKNAALSPRLNRAMRYLITSAAYLRGYERVLARQEAEDKDDLATITAVVADLKGDRRAIRAITESGSKRVTSVFEFDVFGVGKFLADPTGQVKGLRSFMAKRQELEARYGYDALLHHYLEGHYQAYLIELFNDTRAQDDVQNRIARLDTGAGTGIEKSQRFDKFVEDLVAALENSEVIQDNAEATGGIDARHVVLDRQAASVTHAVSDAALERMIAKAAGVRGVIVSVVSMADLLPVMGVSR